MDPFEEQVLGYIRRHRLISKEENVLIGVSGGPDSVALLHILYNLKDILQTGNLVIAHLNHRLRDKESEEDALFVKNLAASLELPIESASADVDRYRRDHRISLEMAARECRYQFFREVSKRLAIAKIALAHTADDQAEEVLLRLFRGTGPGGLSGMRPISSEGIVRPLLFARKVEILRYLERHNLDFRVDQTNRELFCKRNALRLKVIPLVERFINRQAVKVLCRCSELASIEEDWWQNQLSKLWPEVCAKESQEQIVLDLSFLQTMDKAVRRRLWRFAIRRFKGNTHGIYNVHIEDAENLVTKGRSGSRIYLPEGIRILREGDRIIITWEGKPTGSFSRIIDQPGSYHFPEWWLELTIESVPPDFTPPSSFDAFYLDADMLKWPLVIRSWKPGDRFYPLGLGGSKKLQDFFTDMKIPRSQRKSIPILCDQEKICCVLGYRIDERVKISSKTNRMLVVKYQPSKL